jgi:ribosome-binding factor A
MKPRKISRKALRSGCEQVGEQDGLDPRDDRPDGPAPVRNRKALQLSGQVAETLALALADEADALLRDLLVESVAPAPNSTRLLVTLAPSPAAPPLDAAKVLAHLEAAHGRLRQAVAAAVHRRRVPDLTFRIRTG